MKHCHIILASAFVWVATTLAHAQTTCNLTPITINDSGVATPYPSSLNVAGANTPTTVTVRINNLTHTFPDDVDMLLVGPFGQKMIVQSDAGGGLDVAKYTFTLSDAAETALPDATQLQFPSYRPASYGSADPFPAPAPIGPYNEAAPGGTSTLTSTFGGIIPNGTWSLYVVDDAGQDVGSIGNGWCLTLGGADAVSPMRITEMRVRGPSGANDEFIETMNISDVPYEIGSFDGSSGFGLFASDGTLRCAIPNGTVIPAYGHFLCANSVAYSIGGYPSGDGNTATPDATYTTDIPDNAGVALFAVTNIANVATRTRLDAIGSTSEANTLYKEGSGYPALTPFSIDYAFVRDDCGKQGSITNITPCPNRGIPRDTNNNSVDFYFVDTNGTSAGAGQRLGTGGPQKTNSPTSGRTGLTYSRLDQCALREAPPNRVRDFTSDPANNSTFGTLMVRLAYTNNTGAPLTRLRLRLTDLTTFPAPSGISDLRPRTSPDAVVSVDDPPCGSPAAVTVFGTTLEQPPSQPNGGGFNTSFGVPSVTAATPLAAGATIRLQFLFGIQQTGTVHLDLIPEALPKGGGPDANVVGCTDSTCFDYIYRDGFGFDF
jgi:subtilisin-like proprotein convertase family protein